MHVDLFLPESDIISNKLTIFHPVILEDTHVAVIGYSKSNQANMLRSSMWRYLMTSSDKISVSKVKTVFAAQLIEIFIK